MLPKHELYQLFFVIFLGITLQSNAFNLPSSNMLHSQGKDAFMMKNLQKKIHFIKHQQQSKSFQKAATSALKSSKDDEIASLEEKLRRLKEEAAFEEEQGKEAMNMELLETPMPEILSEAWKETEVKEEDSGLGGVIKGVAFIGLFVFLAFFSQVDIGQEDLSTYAGNIKESSRYVRFYVSSLKCLVENSCKLFLY